MEVEDERRSPLSRLLEQLDRRHLGHALAGGTLGAGAALLGFLLLALSLPRAVSADPVIDPRPVIAPTVAKSDRLPLPGGKLAVIAAEVAAERQPSSGVVDVGPDAGSALAYAVGLPATAAGRAIEDHVDRVGPQYASLGPSGLVVPGANAAAIADQGADDEDDDDSVVAVPRARPDHPTAAAEPLAMPRPRPAHLASLAPAPLLPAPGEAAAIPEADEDAPLPPPAPTARREAPGRPTGLLGFFSSPTEPVKAPPKITVDTPFGVPYVLQTASVETACLKSELIDILRRIEAKYGQKAVITSGYRNRGRSGSMHRTCAAADIEIPGVSAAALAAFARTIPGIGGVGTYCHSELVHVDIGTPRDWKYGCGSFFAMRGAPGRWGKVPAALAAAQPVGDARIDPSMLQD
ncbi:MAG: D-Ala-D-Ala carboxypeptidase family metallohydrolase [Hyphomicrobiales bacterium]|nr:D-Ala-D-Ala carboxypeptidase family metallohydrolase [Hyphomicrobiales bacterium]